MSLSPLRIAAMHAWLGGTALACDPSEPAVALRAAPDGAPNTEQVSDVVFSPQPAADSHNRRVEQLIGEAERTLDIAMYSLSDAGIQAALAAAVARGVEVRFLFETASADRKLTGEARQRSKSGRLEQDGVDVRWVNKIMHHKFMLVDGPRDALDAADLGFLVTGSANWSPGAATFYDENTLFLRGHPELMLRMQREFEHLWTHSRDFVGDPELASRPSTLTIDDAAIADEPDTHVYFTSANFDVRGGDTFVVNGGEEIGDALVAAIAGARRSIHLASGHLRLRAVAEALIARAAEDPPLDVRVYLDGQEFIAASTHEKQADALAECLAAAGDDPADQRECNDRGFLYGYLVGAAGVAVRYKYYAYRWHASYAEQMHHKYMIVDGDELWTGSYNLSSNAEHNTFENMLVFRGPAVAELIDRYEDNFAAIWDTGRDDGALAALHAELAAGGAVPLVFPAMALTHPEVDDLKRQIREACPAVDSPDFRARPEAHRRCE
ncbi:phospholipase D-like domain-containing protein [Nannocystis sp. SCPEA4]|uniref:phospholipase D-like domain-containing protein n=1 Tax=Nannocystis sp. SCPEA4 TaxID=2996787 RepID=UPI00226F2F38|nr:phospholipase D-like domain-containing protein [Nannocystis sp. SCPEA4]MCY1059711.1 phospholipase D-like domain-containing protein [Nannocystis sp. SCPEA4]